MSAPDAPATDVAATAVPRPTRIEMVCTGNICRSPMAEIILRALIERSGVSGFGGASGFEGASEFGGVEGAAGIVVTSSGTGGWHVGDGADPRTVAVLGRHGYDGSAHVASQFDASNFADLDLVLAADRGHVRELRRLARRPEDAAKVRLLREFDPAAVTAGTLEVDDPWYGGTADFERCLAEVEAACHGLIDQLSDASGRALAR
ncbi:MAG: low molecular weight phosphotyrosine protein phosphatase [Dermatophilaceae bacterium]|jgi:protein-tyrosine phosphatase|nr:low molecular weight phosphotyrosine protein phosphatase [Dermatophilaceae bacterium]